MRLSKVLKIILIETFTLLKMLFTAILSVLLMVMARLDLTKACALHARQVADSSNGTTFPIMLPGDDEPSNPATIGYFINHLGINVRNATRSIEW
jgi:hypothetical protein